MLSVALAMLRTRWTTLVGTFVALALGVGLIAAMGLILAGTMTAPQRPPQRYADAPLVVNPIEELRVTTAGGVRVQPLHEPRGLPADLVARLGALGPVVVDRAFDARVARLDGGGPAGGGVRIGRPWSAAAFGRYRLTAGRAPRTDREVVVPAGVSAEGATVTVRTAEGARAYSVVGLTAPVPFERVVFFTDGEAGRLSPRVDALVPAAPVDRVRAVVGDAALVRVGDRRRAADPDLRRDDEALVAANALVGTAGGIAGFVSVFVIASTFAYSVDQRRRELALLRVAGATPGQARRMVLAEGLAVGVVASVVGCVLGRRAAPHIAARLVELGFAPGWFTVPDTRAPLVIAVVAGIVTALLGVWSAARRAGRVRALEALRETAVERRAMTPGRWICGLAALGGALILLLQPVLLAPADALKRKQYIPVTMLLLVAFAVLGPVLVPWAARLLGRPLSRLRGATGLLVHEGALAAARRTAATAAPVLLTVGLTACLLSVTATIDRARTAEDGERLRGDYVVVPSDAPGLSREVVDRVHAITGVEVAASYPTAVYAVEPDGALVRHTAHAVDPAAVVDLLRLPVVAGTLAGLRDDTIVVDREWGRAVGDTVPVWLADGTPVSLRVAAVIRDGAGGNGAYLTRRHAGAALAEHLQIRLRAGADEAAVVRALRDATPPGSGAATVHRADGPTDPADPAAGGEGGRAGATGLWIMLGLALAYSGLSLVGTMLMAARDRVRELDLLRLAGATSGQLLRLVVAETLFVVSLGVALAGTATALMTGGLWLCLLRLTGRAVPLVVPWAPIGGVVAGCAVVALLTSVLPVLSATRARPGSP